MKDIFLLSVMTLTLMVTGIQAQAQDADDSDYLSLSVGWYDMNDDEDAADFRIEYRDGHKYFWEIKPFAALEVTSDSSFWVGAGVYADLEVTPQVYVTPSFGAGFYDEGSSDKDLDYFLEFRSQVEVSYEFQNQQRAGVGFGHISNAGLGDSNPGTEILSLYYHVPIDGMF